MEQKSFLIKTDDVFLEVVKEFADRNKISAAEVFKTGARLYMSENLRIKELEDEVRTLRDTLEGEMGSKKHGFIPELDRAVNNLIHRLHKCNSRSHLHFARVLNRWSANTVHASSVAPDMNRKPASDVEQV